MKKYASYILILFFTLGVILMTYFNFNIERVVEISAVFLIIMLVVLFETKELDSKSMAVLATLSALGGVFRVPFAAIPGLQPTTFIAAAAGYTLGPINGFMVGAMSGFISNFFLGQGPWTLWQMMGWGLCGLFFGFIRKISSKSNLLIFASACFVWGYIFGVIVDLWFVMEFIKPFSFKAWFGGVVTSVYFDSIHAIGNFVFTLIFGKKFISLLERYNRKFHVEYLD